MIHKTRNAATQNHPAQNNETDIPSELMQDLSLEETTKHIDALKAIIFNTKEANQAKIDFIKQELAVGKYRINSQRIANELAEFHEIVTQPEPA